MSAHACVPSALNTQQIANRLSEWKLTGGCPRTPCAHAMSTRIWSALLAWEDTDARSCNAYFSLALRGGQTKEAMRTIAHAEAHGLKQSPQMASTARQVRKFKASLANKQ